LRKQQNDLLIQIVNGKQLERSGYTSRYFFFSFSLADPIRNLEGRAISRKQA